MSEVEKIYELAGINKKCTDKRYEKCTGVCYDCKYFIYPPFTAEKQLELIKWLSKRRLLNIAFCENKNTYQLSNNKCTGSFCSDLATAIATLVQCELDFCTEEERKQIKEILE